MALNKFLEFNEQKNEMQTDEQYNADTQRIGGLQTGLARTVLHNKLFRQASVMVSALGKVVADLGKNADDTSRDTLAKNIKDTILLASNHMLEPETSAFYGANDVDDALIKVFAPLSYMAFCTNSNTNSLNVAFGEKNEEYINCLGLQLAMYAWWKGTNKISTPFTHLKSKRTLVEIGTDALASAELWGDTYLRSLIELSPYACRVLAGCVESMNEMIANPASLAFMNSSTNLKVSVQTSPAGVGATKMAVHTVGQNHRNFNSFNDVINNVSLYSSVISSSAAMSWVYCNERNNIKLITKQINKPFASIVDVQSFLLDPSYMTALRGSALGLKSLVMSTNVQLLTKMHEPVNVSEASRAAILSTLRTANAYFNTETSANGGTSGPAFSTPFQSQRSSGTGSSTASWTDSYGGRWTQGISGTSVHTAPADIYILFKDCSCGVSPYGSYASAKFISVKGGVI